MFPLTKTSIANSGRARGSHREPLSCGQKANPGQENAAGETWAAGPVRARPGPVLKKTPLPFFSCRFCRIYDPHPDAPLSGVPIEARKAAIVSHSGNPRYRRPAPLVRVTDKGVDRARLFFGVNHARFYRVETGFPIRGPTTAHQCRRLAMRRTRGYEEEDGLHGNPTEAEHFVECKKLLRTKWGIELPPHVDHISGFEHLRSIIMNMPARRRRTEESDRENEPVVSMSRSDLSDMSLSDRSDQDDCTQTMIAMANGSPLPTRRRRLDFSGTAAVDVQEALENLSGVRTFQVAEEASTPVRRVDWQRRHHPPPHEALD